ncbi:MAG: hypothetical protein PX637_24675 [Microcystis sp. M53601_WE4]|nr:hypothetical protein [Microcystis sp. M53601_WE4]
MSICEYSPVSQRLFKIKNKTIGDRDMGRRSQLVSAFAYHHN